MKKLILLIVFILLYSNVNADILKIRFECDPQVLQEAFLSKGYVVDIEGERRTKYSWGFIRNLGMEYEVITYKPITDKELEMVKEIIWQSQQSAHYSQE